MNKIMDNYLIKRLKPGQIGVLVTPALTYKITMLGITETSKSSNGFRPDIIYYDEPSTIKKVKL